MKRNKIILSVLVLILFLFQNTKTYSEWIKKDNYYELDNYRTEVLNYSILDNGDIWIVNKFAEVFFVDFKTGKLEKKCKCEIPDSLLIKKAYFSTDGQTVSFGLYHKNTSLNEYYLLTNDIIINIYDNTECEKVKDFRYSLIVDYVSAYLFDFLDIDYYSDSFLLNFGLDQFSKTPNGKYDFIHTYGNYFNFDIKDSNVIIYNSRFLFLSKFQSKTNKNYYLSGRSGISKQVLTPYIGSYSNNSYLQKYSEDFKLSERLVFKQNFIDTVKKELFSFSINQVLEYKNNLILSNIYKQDSLFLWEYDENSNLLSEPRSFGLNKNNIHINNDGLISYYYQNKYSIYHYKTAQLLQTMQYPFSTNNSKRIQINNFDYDILLSSDNKIRYIEKENIINNKTLGFVTNDTLIRVDSLVRLYSIIDNENYTYTWDLGNDVITTNSNYLEYKYKIPGLYSIKLKLSDKDGKEYNYEKLNYITVVSNLKSNFAYKFDNEFKGICYFESKAKGNPTFYQWDYGDGVQSNEIDPVHKYLTYGDFKVRYIVGDSIAKDTSFQNVSYYDKYAFSDISQRAITKSLINMPRKTQAVDVFGDSLTFFQFNYHPHKMSRNFDWKDFYFEIYLLEIFFNLDKELLNTYNNDFPFVREHGTFASFNLPNEDSYVHLYDFILMRPNFVNYKYNDNKFNIAEYGSRMYSLSPQKNNHLKMMKIDNNSYYVNYINEPSFFINLKNVRGSVTYKKLNFNKEISNSYSLKVNNKNFALVSFKDFSYTYFVYENNDTTFNFKELNINKNINIENIIQKDEDNLLIYGKEVFSEGNSLGVIIELNLITNETIYKTYKNCYNIKKIEKMSNTSLLVLPEVYGPKGYMILDNELNVKLDNRVPSIPVPIEFLLHIQNKVYMIYQIPSVNNSKTGSFKDEYTTFVVMDSSLTDEITGIDTETNPDNNFLIFPNPSSDKISVDLGGVALADMVVYDILGNEIISIPNYTNKSEIDISTLSIGTYTIQIQTSTGSISQRLLVNR